MDEVPFDDRHVPRAEIDWERSVWWWYPLTRAIQPAVRMTALILGLVAILLAQLGLGVGTWLFRPDWHPSAVSPGPAIMAEGGWSLNWTPRAVPALFSFESLGLRELAFTTFLALWLTVVFGLFGGVLARRSLVELGQRTIATWGESIRMVFSRWLSILWSTGLYLVGIGGLLIPVLVLGWFSRWGAWAAIVAGVLLLICFPLVFGIGRLALGAIVCFPLSVCAIAAEKKADAFEGFSRSNAYFFQRPFVVAACVFCLLVIGVVGQLVVTWTLTLGWTLVRETYLVGGGSVQPVSDRYISAGNWLINSLIRAYWFSFFWSAAAATYLILRRSVDSTQLDELDSLESSVEQTLPEIPSVPPASSAAPAGEAEDPQPTN